MITFREPRNSDRQKVLDSVKPNEKFSVDELLASFCLETVNGNPPRDPDPRYKMASWTLRDSQAFVTLFLDMFTLGEDDVREVREQAKKLLRPELESTSE